MTVTYTIGDTRDVIATIPDGSISLIATSPPFIALRSYLPADHPDKHAEIGSEPDPATFIDTLLELTAEWGRVLAPWGSIAIELGDTYAGTGGAGGDWSDSPNTTKARVSGGSDGGPPRRIIGQTWPRAKCLALVPQAYALSLAYGRNVLTGQPSPAGRWLVRNIITWHRPNPAVGALGDKYRPSTSQIVVATRSAKRWFDLTAVRTPHTTADSRGNVAYPRQMSGRLGDDGENGSSAAGNHAAGAPPLDTWFDHHDGSHDTWTLTTQPSSIKATVVERVPCGPDDGGERTTSPNCPVHGDLSAPAPTAPGGEPPSDPSTLHTPHTDARHDPERDPADSHDASTSSRSGQPAASGRSTSSSRTAPAPSTGPPDTPSAQTVADTAHTSTSPESCGDHPDTSASSSAEACPPADELETAPHSEHTQGQESACSCTFHVEKHSVHSHYAMWPAKLAERLILSMCPAEVCTQCGEPRRRVDTYTLDSFRGSARPQTMRAVALADRHGLTPSHIAAVRSVGISGDGKAREINTGHGKNRPEVQALYDEAKAVLRGYVREFCINTEAKPTSTWTSCPCGAPFIPGTVLDPFAGTGTTLAVADLHGRDAIGIDIDERNANLAPERIGMFLTVTDTRKDIA